MASSATKKMSMMLMFCMISASFVVGSRIMDSKSAVESNDSGFTTIIRNNNNSTKVGDSYCCLENGIGQCKQYCDSDKNWACCIKNGNGCQQLCIVGVDYRCCLENYWGCIYKCETGKDYYCCQDTWNGCKKMCPTANLAIQLPSSE